MTRVQFEARCRSAVFWAIVFVVVGEYFCRDAPFQSPAWLAAGIVLACLGVLFGRIYLATAFGSVSNAADTGRFSSALSRIGFVSIAVMVLALGLGWTADTDALFEASVAGGDLGFGLFVLWTEFWFRQPLVEEPAKAAARR
jgi:Kef-type K+ transport system membrane component KefB